MFIQLWASEKPGCLKIPSHTNNLLTPLALVTKFSTRVLNLACDLDLRLTIYNLNLVNTSIHIYLFFKKL